MKTPWATCRWLVCRFVDVGGQMSHAVIVSRELGRPCVVAATGATARIPDGALVRVDGAAGTVTVVSAPDRDVG